MAQTRSGTKAAANSNNTSQQSQQRQRGSFSEALLAQQRSQRHQRSTTPREIRAVSIAAQKRSFISRFLLFFVHLWQLYLESDCHLKQAQLIRLSTHVYSAVDTSWLDHLFMGKFWNWIVQWYPLWLAPNLITLVGLLINFGTVLILSHYCYTATETAPFWAYLQAALGLFFYQTLDATDGKQARRTQSSSPLGELFDHGCDSMAQVLVTLNICYAMQLGTERHLMLTVMIFSIALFYTAHWSTYCTGQLRFSKYDVTEAQMTVIAILIFTSITGPGIWNIRFFGWQVKIIFLLTCLLFGAWQFCGYLKMIFNEGVGKNGSTVAGTSVVYPLFPLLAVCVPFVMLYCKSRSGVYDKNITLLILCFGAVGAKTTNRLIIAHMSRSELELWDWIYLSPFVMILNQYYDYVVDEYALLLIATIHAYVSLLIFCIYVCRQFCEFLQINCFRLSPSSADLVAEQIRDGPATSGSKKFLHVD